MALIVVLTIYFKGGAFAAAWKDGTVVTWGNKNVNGDSSSIQAALIGVERVYTT